MINLPKVHFFFVGLFVANLLQYKHTALRFDASIPTKKKRMNYSDAKGLFVNKVLFVVSQIYKQKLKKMIYSP